MDMRRPSERRVLVLHGPALSALILSPTRTHNRPHDWVELREPVTQCPWFLRQLWLPEGKARSGNGQRAFSFLASRRPRILVFGSRTGLVALVWLVSLRWNQLAGNLPGILATSLVITRIRLSLDGDKLGLVITG